MFATLKNINIRKIGAKVMTARIGNIVEKKSWISKNVEKLNDAVVAKLGGGTTKRFYFHSNSVWILFGFNLDSV